MKKILLLTLLIVGLTAAVWLATDPGAELATSSTSLSESALDGVPSDLPAAPDFDLAAFPEGTLNSEDLKGKVVVVDFWATWCQPCIAEIPDLNALHNEQDPDKFAMIGITIESGAYEDIAAQLATFDIDYPLVMGDEAVTNGFGGIIGYPTKFVVGPDWTIYKKYFGGDKKEEIERDVDELLGNAEIAQVF